MHNLNSWYQQQTASGEFNYDPAQAKLLAELQEFLTDFASLNFITRLWRSEHKLGYYIYGDVGTGKSMIMNAMFQYTATERKTRIHFHEFMHQTHTQLSSLTDSDDPLSLIVSRLKDSYDIIYLDEMHISDIATAMILKRLLESLFENKIYIVTSSNYQPDDLWPNGLMRERFLPAIAVLKERLNVVNLAAQQDYRRINDSVNQLFIRQSPDSQNQLMQIFQSINQDVAAANNTSAANTRVVNTCVAKPSVKICNRDIPVIKLGTKIVWFDFKVICGDMRSQLDYLELAQKYQWIIISNIFKLGTEQKDIARRFTWLIDILYDNQIKLALSTAVLIQDIYAQGDFANEFTRTISRLEEMQTQEYLEKRLTAKAC